MTTHVGANEAARLLGVTKPTLYAYVSRGVLSRRLSPDGRTSLYARDEIERLRSRSRRRPAERATIDVAIESSVTALDDRTLRYRGHDVATLATTCSFERVAELLWTGSLADLEPTWPIDRTALAACRAALTAAGPRSPMAALALAAAVLASDHGDDAPTAARRLITIAPSLVGGPDRGTIPERLAVAWATQPTVELVDAIRRTLVLLADHELATSTLAVRVAASVRANPYAALATGLHVIDSPYHGAANAAVTSLLRAVRDVGPADAVRHTLESGRRLPGFGHSIYRNGDPRLAPLLDAVRSVAEVGGRGAGGRMVEVDAVLAEAGRRIGQLPNVDFGLGALVHVAQLPIDIAPFAIARMAGWAAHFVEELTERPVRFRGVSTRHDGN